MCNVDGEFGHYEDGDPKSSNCVCVDWMSDAGDDGDFHNDDCDDDEESLQSCNWVCVDGISDEV